MTYDLRTLLNRAVEHAVDYRASLNEHAGRPDHSYAEMRDRLLEPLPEQGMAPPEVLEELVRRSAGGLMPITGPRFFGWVMGASHPAGVAADWLVSAWGQNAGYHTPTPAAAAMEEVAEHWLLDILDLPRHSSIGFTTGATVAGAVGLAAARTRVLLDAGWDPDADGLFGAPPVHVLIGDDAHSSMFSALQLIGFGYRRLIRVATDSQGRMSVAALDAALRGLSGPKIVVAQAGQINTGAYDRFADIIPIAHAAGAWVHVDGAFGLWARATPSLKHLTDGIEAADSWVTDGHKWLQVPYDSGFAIVRDREAHQRAMTQWASYLPSISPTDRVPSAFVPELSRRARGTPVWAMLKTLGRQGRGRAGRAARGAHQTDGRAARRRAGHQPQERCHHQPTDRRFRHGRHRDAQGAHRGGNRWGAGRRRVLCRRGGLARRLGDADLGHLRRHHDG